MSVEQRAQQMSSSDVSALLASHQALEAQVDELKRQVDWFKKQLFGRKSERRLVEPSPDQLSLGEDLKHAATTTAERTPQQIPSHTRRLSAADATSWLAPQPDGCALICAFARDAH